jgi:hypothetical protein
MKISTLIFFSMVLVTIGCKTKEDSKLEVIESPIFGIESPETAIVGDNVKIKVHFTGHNGCALPYSVEADKVGQNIVFKAYYSVSDNDQICTANIQEMDLDYTFFADLPGPYFFSSSMDVSITDTLVVL